MADIFRWLKKFSVARRVARWLRHDVRDACYDVARRLTPAWPRLGPVKGLFSACEALRAGVLPGRVVMEAQESKLAGPSSLRQLSRLEQDQFQPWPIFWTQHRQARLIGPTALLVNERKQACSEALFNRKFHDDPGCYLLHLPKPVELAGNWTSVLSRWALGGNYYHWLMDCLPRLAVLGELPSDTRILVPAPPHSFQKETLRLLGLEGRTHAVTEPHLVVENYYFSAPTAMTGCANPYAVKFLRERFLPLADVNGPTHEKIYIQRRGGNRGMVNEAELVAFLKGRGWSVVALESLTFAQQVNLFRGARAVCGLHGAGFTNLLWCPPGCVAVELVAHNFLNGCYEGLAGHVGVEHRFLVNQADAEFRILVDLIQLAAVLGDL